MSAADATRARVAWLSWAWPLHVRRLDLRSPLPPRACDRALEAAPHHRSQFGDWHVFSGRPRYSTDPLVFVRAVERSGGAGLRVVMLWNPGTIVGALAFGLMLPVLEGRAGDLARAVLWVLGTWAVTSMLGFFARHRADEFVREIEDACRVGSEP